MKNTFYNLYQNSIHSLIVASESNTVNSEILRQACSQNTKLKKFCAQLSDSVESALSAGIDNKSCAKILIDYNQMIEQLNILANESKINPELLLEFLTKKSLPIALASIDAVAKLLKSHENNALKISSKAKKNKKVFVTKEETIVHKDKRISPLATCPDTLENILLLTVLVEVQKFDSNGVFASSLNYGEGISTGTKLAKAVFVKYYNSPAYYDTDEFTQRLNFLCDKLTVITDKLISNDLIKKVKSKSFFGDDKIFITDAGIKYINQSNNVLFKNSGIRSFIDYALLISPEWDLNYLIDWVILAYSFPGEMKIPQKFLMSSKYEKLKNDIRIELLK